MIDYLKDSNTVYSLLGIAPNTDMDIWLAEYLRQKWYNTGLRSRFILTELGDITKLSTMLWLVNNLLKERVDINTAPIVCL